MQKDGGERGRNDADRIEAEAAAVESRFERWRGTVGLFVGPALGLLIYLLPGGALSPAAHRLGAVLALVGVYWITEAIPLAASALLGAVLIVGLGVAPTKEVLPAFSDPVIFLFIGSFMLARAMQVHRLDLRLAYSLLARPWIASSPDRMIWALGVTAWLISMWMSNTACVAMLFPVAMAIARSTGQALREGGGPSAGVAERRFTTGLLLMLAYAGSIGGLATPVGTPPNLIGIALIQQTIGVRIGFLEWMRFGLPISILLLLVAYGIVLLFFRSGRKEIPGQLARIRDVKRSLGPWSAGERNSLIAFCAAIVNAPLTPTASITG